MPTVLINGVPTEVTLDQIFQDDGVTPFTTGSLAATPPPGRTFSEEDVARIRQEEKDKLYSAAERNNQELTALREQVGSLTAAEQRREAQLLEEQQNIEAEARRAEEEGLEAKDLVQRAREEWNQTLAQKEQEWNARFTEAEQARQTAEALSAKEREFSDLREYITTSVETNKDQIAPQLLPWISGNSKEEVDAAIARAVETTNQIAAEMQEALGQPLDPQQQQQIVYPGGQVAVVQQPAPPALPGTRATGGPGNTDPSAQHQELSLEQIANMPMDQYAKLRGQMGIGGQSNNRGLFG